MLRTLALTLPLIGIMTTALVAAECRIDRFEPESGYRFDGSTLVMPGGGRHVVGGDGRAVLRETYGLFGPDTQMMRTIFADACGERYEVGYRLDANTLQIPFGGSHTITNATEAEAEAILREAYGLVGDRDRLVRTKW